MPSSPVDYCLMILPASAATTTASAKTASSRTSTTKYVCALVFPSGEAGGEADLSLLKRKRADMSCYSAAARNALCFFASSSNNAQKCDAADYNALRQVA